MRERWRPPPGDVAGALSEPVDRTVNEISTRRDGRERVRDAQSEVVVGVGADRAEIGEAGDRFVGVFRPGVADGVGETKAVRARFEGGFGQSLEVVEIRARAVFADDLDPEVVVRGVGDQFGGVLEVVRAGRADLALDVAVAGGNDDVDPVDVTVEREVDVAFHPATETRDAGVEIEIGHSRNRLSLTRARTGAAGLDDGDAGALERPGDVDFLVGRERDARCLFAVAKRRVEKAHCSIRCDRLFGGVRYRQEWSSTGTAITFGGEFHVQPGRPDFLYPRQMAYDVPLYLVTLYHGALKPPVRDHRGQFCRIAVGGSRRVERTDGSLGLETESVAGFDVGRSAGGEFEDQVGRFASHAPPRAEGLDALDDVVDDPNGVDGNEDEQHVEGAALRRLEPERQRVVVRNAPPKHEPARLARDRIREIDRRRKDGTGGPVAGRSLGSRIVDESHALECERGRQKPSR